MRAVIYARYSSENQREASIEDQVRICRAHIQKLGAELVATYSDHAISGATRLRPGYQKLLEDARSLAFDVVVVEALDRISRDQEDVAGCYKLLTFANVKLITLSEGEINELHVGLKGTMNALFLKDLALKTHRGLEGRVRAGKSAGGRAYGYRVKREISSEGEPVAGLRTIQPDEAKIVRRIFRMFAAGTSPRSIAKILNDESLAGPNGRFWSDTTIRGHAERRTGILRNDLYQGKLVWNKQRYVKDPRTGKRLARINPKSAWIVQEARDLRIVDDALWAKVQERLDSINSSPGVTKAKATKFWENRRHKHFLTGIAACSKCGGSLASVGKDYLACSRARRSGTCSNKTSIRRSVLEEAVLSALKDNLMQPHLVEEFVSAYHEEINAKTASASTEREASERHITKVRKQIDAIIDSIANGYRSESMRLRLEDLESRREFLERQIAKPVPTKVRFHPRLPELYRKKVERLAASLSEPGIRDEAVTLLRELIEEVKVSPTENGWDVEISGEVGRMVNLAEGKTEHNQCSVKVVAGTRNCLKLLLETQILAAY